MEWSRRAGDELSEDEDSRVEDKDGRWNGVKMDSLFSAWEWGTENEGSGVDGADFAVSTRYSVP